MGHNIYLGIDGVILTKGVLPALHLDRFLKYILANFSVSWLSYRCRGSSEDTVKYLSQFLAPNTIALIKAIKPTSFQLDKTEAIDFNRSFYWLDNQLFDSEKNALREHDNYKSWIELDLIKNPNQLLHIINSKRILR
jgi:hypothetical protein